MRCFSGIITKTEVKTPGISMPPQNPCTMRSAMKGGSDVHRAHATLASVKPSVASANIQRSDSARVSQPVSGMAITSAIR
jgi:hypothetical protein